MGAASQRPGDDRRGHPPPVHRSSPSSRAVGKRRSSTARSTDGSLRCRGGQAKVQRPSGVARRSRLPQMRGSNMFKTAQSPAGCSTDRRSTYHTVIPPGVPMPMHPGEEGVQQPRRRQPRGRLRHEAQDEVDPPEQGEPEPVGTGSVAAVDRHEDRDEQDGDRRVNRALAQSSEGDFRAAKATPADRTISSRVPSEKRGRLMAVTGRMRREVCGGRLAPAWTREGRGTVGSVVDPR